MGRNAFLAAGHEMKRQHPLAQADVATLHDRSDRDGELAATRTAVEQPVLSGLAFHAVDVLDIAAMRAVRAIGPAQGFKVFTGLGFVVKDRIGKVEIHGLSRYD